MLRAYGILLRLYPSDYRSAFAGEMLRVFEQAARQRRELGPLRYFRFLLSEFRGCIAGALAERFRRPRMPHVAHSSSTATALPAEVLQAQKRVDYFVNCMVHAIANHEFENARRFSEEDRKARENVRQLRLKYNLTDAS